MPADDVIFSVRQISGYPPVAIAPPGSTLVLQTRGLGSPYASITPADLVSTALANMPGDLYAAGRVAAGSINSPCGIFDTLSAQKFTAQRMTLAGVPVATEADISAILSNSVFSFNMRFGHVMLELQDIVCAGGAPIRSPRFRGEPRAPTPASWSNTTRLATTEFVHRNSVLYINDLLSTHPFVFTFNGRTGDVVLTPEDIGNVEGALLNSPALQGTPTAPTPPSGDNSTRIATTEFVTAAVAAATDGLAAVYAPIDAPNLTGYATAPTAPPGTNTAQIATTAFVQAAVSDSTAGVASFNGRTGIVTLEPADITSAGGAVLNSPAFVGAPTAPTPAAANNSNQIATTAWVLSELGGANIGVMSFNGRTGVITLNTSDIASAGGAPAASPILTGTPTAPTASTGTSTDQIATTAFVMAAITTGGVASFNGRTGAVSLLGNDVSAAGGLINPSPNLTGSPTATTATFGDATTRIATTAFVQNAIAAAGGVASFNTRTGAVTLNSTDIANAGGATTAYTQATYATIASLNSYLPLAGGTLTGALSIAPASGVAPTLTLASNAATAAANQIFGQTGASPRWLMSLGDGSAETGSNAGSNFYLGAYGDNGALIRNQISITRSSGAVQFVCPQIALFSTAGVASPGFYILDNNGAQRLSFTWSSSSNQAACGFGSAYWIINSSGNFVISSATAYKPGGGSWTDSSDDRIKEVLHDYDKGLNEILALRPVVFRYRGNETPTRDTGLTPSGERPAPRHAGAPYPASPHYGYAISGAEFTGFVAQEVEDVMPRMVSRHAGFIDGEPVDDIRDLDVSSLVHTLVNAVKQLAARVAALEAA